MKIALTGGIAQGKSTVLAALREMGVKVESSDQIARECLEAPENAAAVAEAAGLTLPIDRDELRRRLASKPPVRRAVNHLLHPLVLERIRHSDAEVIEVPLLIESAIMGEFDAIWCVTCAPDEQRRRLSLRLGSEAEADRLIAVQLPSQVKEAFADEIIRTDGAPDSVFKDIQETARRWSLKGLLP